MMVEQHKRPLEFASSLQPAKYYKHCDDGSGKINKWGAAELNGLTNVNNQGSTTFQMFCKPVQKDMPPSSSSVSNVTGRFMKSNTSDLARHCGIQTRSWRKVEQNEEVDVIMGPTLFSSSLQFENMDRHREDSRSILAQEDAMPFSMTVTVKECRSQEMGGSGMGLDLVEGGWGSDGDTHEVVLGLNTTATSNNLRPQICEYNPFIIRPELGIGSLHESSEEKGRRTFVSGVGELSCSGSSPAVGGSNDGWMEREGEYVHTPKKTEQINCKELGHMLEMTTGNLAYNCSKRPPYNQSSQSHAASSHHESVLARQVQLEKPSTNQLPQLLGNFCEELESEDLTAAGTFRKQVPIGHNFQAELPPLISTHGTALQSIEHDLDSCRWLGIRVWPPTECRLLACIGKIGKGRTAICSCAIRDSVDCVRQHIEQGREALKDEVGEAFYAWGFDEMGECVSKHWMREEESNFEELVRMNPYTLKKNFWDHLSIAFPSKTRRELVSYYFNVFVLRRRALQNRCSPDNIDSDDDETELFESEGDESPSEADDEADDSQVDDDASGDEADENVSSVSEDYGDEECTQNSDATSHKAKTDGLIEDPVAKPSPLLLMTVGCQDERFDSKPNNWVDAVSSRGDATQAGQTWEILWDQTYRHSSSQEERRSGPNYVPFFSDDRQTADDSSRCKDGFLISSHPVLDQFESKVWDGPMEISSRKDVDKLISTNGMMREFFGDDGWKGRE